MEEEALLEAGRRAAGRRARPRRRGPRTTVTALRAGPPAAPTAARRARDAGATRRRPAGAPPRTCSASKGYERTTTREIGEAAGVDPALIARYFGSKADLYLAAVAADRLDDDEVDGGTTGPTRPSTTWPRWSRWCCAGPPGAARARSSRPWCATTPRRRSATRPRPAWCGAWSSPWPPATQAAGPDRPALRAQVAVAAVLGVSLGRSLGWFDELHAADPDELAGAGGRRPGGHPRRSAG